jgi:hypothetical protein
LAVFLVPAADLFVFAIFLLASFRPDAVVTVSLAVERFFARAAARGNSTISRMIIT